MASRQSCTLCWWKSRSYAFSLLITPIMKEQTRFEKKILTLKTN